VSGTVGQPLVYDYRFFTGEALLTVEVTDDDGATAQVSQLLDIGFPPRRRRLPRLAGARRLINAATATATVPLPEPVSLDPPDPLLPSSARRFDGRSPGIW
jgi:hypothetical protein